MQRSPSRASLVLLPLLLLSGSCQAAAPSTTPATTPTAASTTTTTTELTSTTPTAKLITSSAPKATTSAVGGDVEGEVSHLLTQLREVADSLKQAREEHERLATAVAQVTAAVREMGEHNLHIKKKVRKMSKGLKRSTHNKKIKEGLKALQRDHQRILHAITLHANLSRSHANHSRAQHTPQHRPRPRNKTHHPRPTAHPASHNTTHKPRRQNKGEKEGASETKSSKSDVKKEVKVEVEGEGGEGGGDNVIPELVVDPPSPTDPPLPADCTEVMQRGNWTSGTYLIQPRGLHPVKVWCDHTTNGGGWTVLLARLEQTDQEDFSRGWADYKAGFGDPAGEHWLGLDALHAMSKGRLQELRVNITDWHNNTAWAEWKEFSVGSESEKYPLTVVRYASDSVAGDALKWHNGMKFSTPDQDNDFLLGGHCAKKNDGGWWYRGYRGCYQAHPTGRYQINPGDPPKTSVTTRNFDLGPVLVWQNWRGESYYPRTLFLMFRPALN